MAKEDYQRIPDDGSVVFVDFDITGRQSWEAGNALPAGRYKFQIDRFERDVSQPKKAIAIHLKVLEVIDGGGRPSDVGREVFDYFDLGDKGGNYLYGFLEKVAPLSVLPQNCVNGRHPNPAFATGGPAFPGAIFIGEYHEESYETKTKEERNVTRLKKGGYILVAESGYSTSFRQQRGLPPWQPGIPEQQQFTPTQYGNQAPMTMQNQPLMAPQNQPVPSNGQQPVQSAPGPVIAQGQPVPTPQQ